MENPIVLKPGRERSVKNRHHWIFSGAVESLPGGAEDGEVLKVESHSGEMLGHAYINRKSGIVGRFVSFGEEEPMGAIERHLKQALDYRSALFDAKTTGYRLVNAEGDNLPGLIVDRYGDVLVMQVATLGMEKLKQHVADWLMENIRPSAIYEKSNLPARKEEGLNAHEGWLYGGAGESVDFFENGLKFKERFLDSQKTGFFLDQREMRALAKRYSSGRSVLNCFAYTGGFNVAVLAGGALRADGVEVSAAAGKAFAENLELNGMDPGKALFFEADVFDFLRSGKAAEYDFIILDPPAFAKRRSDVVQACRGYKDINRLAIKNVKPGGLVLTSSCSHFVDDKLFGQVIFEAAAEAGRETQIISRHILAPDHPLNVYHPEGEYLKSALLKVY